MPKLRVEIEGPDGGAFITRDGEVVQQQISSLGLALSNSERTLIIGQPVPGIVSEMIYEAQVTYPVGKATLIIDYEERGSA
jgi:hypothetical protein